MEIGNRGVLRGVMNFFAVQMLWGVVLARKLVQWEFFAFFIALKYPCLESRARLTRPSVRCSFALLQALAYSLCQLLSDFFFLFFISFFYFLSNALFYSSSRYKDRVER